MGAFLRKYGTGTGADVYVPIIKRAVVDFAVSADWTPAAGDVKVSKDGGAAANIGTLPTAVTMGNTAMWKFVFADAELQCKVLAITVADSATKAVEDQMLLIETYGNASAMYQPDLSAANLPANMTQILGTAPTEGDAGQLAGGFTKWFNVATPTGTINSLPDAVAGASGGVLISGSNSGTTTLGALTVTGASTLTGGVSVAAGMSIVNVNGTGLTISSTGANGDAISATGNGTGHGMHLSSGNGLTGDALHLDANSTNGNALYGLGSGTGDGAHFRAGTVGHGLYLIGGSTSGAALTVAAFSGSNANGAEFIKDGTGKDLVANITGDITGNLSGSIGSLGFTLESSDFGTDWLTATGLAASAVTEIWAAVADSPGVTTLLSRLSSARAGYLDNLSAGAVALASGVTVTTNNDKTGYSLAAAGLDAVLVESSITAGAGLTNDAGSQLTNINARQALSLNASALAGILAGAATSNVTFKPAGKPSGNTRIDATVDADGNRSSINLKVPT